MIHFVRKLLVRLFKLGNQSGTETEETKRPSSTRSPAPQEKVVAEVMVFVSSNGQKYHTEDCKMVVNAKTPIKLEATINRYEPCKICNPPTVKTAS